MTSPYRLTLALGLILCVSLAVTRAADGQVPTAVDSTTCNQEAPATARAGMATPTAGDHARAERARAGATNAIVRAGTLVESPDPQIHGMDAEGAKTPTYQAAYRSCMRRKGF